MLSAVRSVLSLLLSTLLLLVAAGLLTSLVPLRGQQLGFPGVVLGGFTSAYYAGFLLGTFIMPPLIRRIGHIRAFAFCTAFAAIVMLLHAMDAVPWAWLLLRFLAGVLLVGLYTIIESWLNAQAPQGSRSIVFATYMMVNLGGLALGQQLLRIDGQAFVLFSVVAIFTCAATLPVLLTQQPQPPQQSTSFLNPFKLFGVVPSAVTAALLTGLAMGSFYGLAPVYAGMIGFDTAHISTYISMGIAGGIVLQWPLGLWSDHTDRRITIAFVGAVAALMGIAMMLAGNRMLPALVVIFVYGGMALAVYPMVVAHIVDHLSPSQLVAASSSVLLVYGAGSATGPVVVGALMSWIGPTALPAWFIATNGLMALYAAYRYRTFRRHKIIERNFLPMRRTTPAALQMMPDAQAETSAGAAAPANAETERAADAAPASMETIGAVPEPDVDDDADGDVRSG